jgi:hypothetical protein
MLMMGNSEHTRIVVVVPLQGGRGRSEGKRGM